MGEQHLICFTQDDAFGFLPHSLSWIIHAMRLYMCSRRVLDSRRIGFVSKNSAMFPKIPWIMYIVIHQSEGLLIQVLWRNMRTQLVADLLEHGLIVGAFEMMQ